MIKKIISYLLFLTIIFPFATPLQKVVKATGTTYYISSSEGDDENNGTSSSTPWQTISKLNSITFQSEDTILFKKGDTWTGEIFYPQGNGDYFSDEWITIDAYGTGAKPIISPGTNEAVAIMFDREDFTGGWKIKNLKIQNCKMGIDVEKTLEEQGYGFWVENCEFYNITGNNIGSATNPGFANPVWCSMGLFTFYVNCVTLKNSIFAYNDVPFDIRSYYNTLIDGVVVDHCYRGAARVSVHGMFSSGAVIQNCRVSYVGYRDGMWWGTSGITLLGALDKSLIT
jgi:hypothetical protein